MSTPLIQSERLSGLANHAMAQAAARALAFGLNTCKSVLLIALYSCIIIEGGAAFTPLVKFRTLLASNFLTLANQKIICGAQAG
jgi:hypothetical protein